MIFPEPNQLLMEAGIYAATGVGIFVAGSAIYWGYEAIKTGCQWTFNNPERETYKAIFNKNILPQEDIK